MDDSMRVEYPGMLENLQPSQAAQLLNDRVKRIAKVHLEIAEWLQERRKVEEQYVQGLKKLTQFRVPNAQSELGTFQVQWDKMIQSADALAMSHHLFATKIERDVEQPLRSFSARKEMANMQTIQGNLQNMAKELDEAQKKNDAAVKKASKMSASKMDQAAARLEAATNQWESQAPFIFETLQALDETRLNHLRDALTQYGTYEGEQAQEQQRAAESVLNALLDFNTANEIQAFVAKSTAGRPKLEKRTTTQPPSTTGSSTAATPSATTAPAPNFPPAPRIPDDAQSDHSGPKEDKGGENKLRSRIGTMLGRRRQSVHGGFGQLSPAKGPFRTTRSSHGASPRASSTNLNEAHHKLSALAEGPDSPGFPPESAGLNGKASHEGTNGFGNESLMDAPERNEPARMNGTSATTDVSDVPPPPGPPPSQQHAEPGKDAEGFNIPAPALDPISAAQKEAAGDENEPAFKLSIQQEPIAEEDPEEREAALSKFTNSLSAMGTPARRSSTIRGRRDVRNTIYVPAPVSEGSASPSPFQPISNGPSATFKPPVMASEPSVAGTSDTHSIRSSNSLGGVVHHKHPDMHEPGLNSSIMETISATFAGGEIKTVKVNGEIAFAYNAADAFGADTHQSIRINNFAALESIGPNRIYVTHAAPDQPDQFTLDTSHIRPSQATVGFSYRLHVDPNALPVERVPLLIHPAWKPQGDKLGLLLQYKLNPAFQLAGGSTGNVTLHNVVLFATYEGKASGAQTKPPGTHVKDKHLVYWRLGDVTLSTAQDWQKIVCRIVGEAGVEPQPGTVEARWEFAPEPNAAQDVHAISVSRLGEGKGKEADLHDEDPFADVGENESAAEGRWLDVPAVRRLVSGKYEAT